MSASFFKIGLVTLVLAISTLSYAQTTVPSMASPMDANSAVTPDLSNSSYNNINSGADATEVKPQSPQYFDYSQNIRSDVFGSNLFTGSFARQGATQFNPDYVIAIGDKIQVRLWGAFEYGDLLTVDPQGNIFIPNAGPINVVGIRNKDLQQVVESSITQVFKANVYIYASLAAAQPVRVFVSGFVNRPGLYSGTSMDSLLHYLDQAGGIDPERGSFLDVEVKRGQQIRNTVNLYDFLLNGIMPVIQLADGDVIFVGPRQNTVKVSGLTENARRFEFSDATRTVADLMKIAKPDAAATHVRIIRNTGIVRNVDYYPLTDAAKVMLKNGDELEFTSDKKIGTITVRVEGEHESSQEYVLPYGAKLGDLLSQIRYSDRSDKDNLQLFRRSVKDRQKEMLEISLKSLENAALTARSGTDGEATLRKEEASLLLQWVDRARKIEPKGQVVIADTEKHNGLLLENGDVIKVPTKDGLVLISGEVLFPNAIAFNTKYKLSDYIKSAGGYTQNANSARIIVAHRNGSFTEVNSKNGLFHRSDRVDIVAGDEILVLPKISVKSRQILKDMTQILYQIAVSAKVALTI